MTLLPLRAQQSRVLNKIQKTKGCWEWKAAKNTSGYGRVQYLGRMWQAHRAVYEILKGQIPSGLTLDHLCRNRACVNPEHLDPVTLKENLSRGAGPPAINARKKYCSQGHSYRTLKNGWRKCIICYNKWAKDKYKNDKKYRDKKIIYSAKQRLKTKI